MENRETSSRLNGQKDIVEQADTWTVSKKALVHSQGQQGRAATIWSSWVGNG